MIFIEVDSMDPSVYFALEEYLCLEKKFTATCFFLWRTQPTVMLGNFQNSYKELNLPAIERDQVQVIRRNTGGGTIYTDPGSLQFSFVMPGQDDYINFTRYMDPIIAALANLGIEATYNSRNDLAIAGKKISGNAQCTKGNYTLHHGSLLYATDFSKMADYLRPPAYKIEAKGIQSVRERTANISQFLSEQWSVAEFRQRLIHEILQQAVTTYTLTAEDYQAIQTIADQKFRSWEWTYGKNPQFSVEKGQKFTGGYLEISLDVKAGRIQACQLAGDFFSAGDVTELESALVDQPFEKTSLTRVIDQPRFQQLLYNISTQDILACLFD